MQREHAVQRASASCKWTSAQYTTPIMLCGSKKQGIGSRMDFLFENVGAFCTNIISKTTSEFVFFQPISSCLPYLLLVLLLLIVSCVPLLLLKCCPLYRACRWRITGWYVAKVALPFTQ